MGRRAGASYHACLKPTTFYRGVLPREDASSLPNHDHEPHLVLNNRSIICPGEELSDPEAGVHGRYKALENLSPAYLNLG